MRNDIKVKVTQALAEGDVANDFIVTRLRMDRVREGDFLAYVAKDDSVEFHEVVEVADADDPQATTLLLEGGGIRSAMSYIPVDVARPRR